METHKENIIDENEIEEKKDINKNNNNLEVKLYRIIALFLILIICFSTNFTDSSEGTMKSIIKENLNIDNIEYSTIVSSVSLMGTIFPFINGILTDKFGSGKAIVSITFVLTLSSIINLISAYLKNYKIMILGNVVQGIVDISMEPVQWTILSELFNTNNMTFLIGLQMSIQRIGKTIGKISANPIYEKTKNFVTIYWIIFGFYIISTIISLLYLLYSYLIEKKYNNIKNNIKYKRFKIINIFNFPNFYWYLLFVIYIQASMNVSFLSINTEMIKERFNTTNVMAGYISSLNTAIPIALCPLIGIFIDKIGYRSIIFLSASYCNLIAWILLKTTYSIYANYIAVILTSLSIPLTIVRVPSMIFILIENKNLFTTSTGLKWCISSAGTSLIQNLAGIIQDNTKGKTYYYVIVLYLILSILSTFFSNLLVLYDIKSKYNGILSSNNKKILKNKEEREKYFKINYNYVGICFYIIVTLLAWAIFIYATIKK